MEFYSVGRARSKKSIFCIFRVSFDYTDHSLQETVLPKPMVPMESRDSEGVPFAGLESVTRHLADIGPWRVPKSGHVWKFAYRHVENFTDSKNAILFYLDENNEVIAEKSLRYSRVIRCLAILNRRSSSIHPSSFWLQYPRVITFLLLNGLPFLSENKVLNSASHVQCCLWNRVWMGSAFWGMRMGIGTRSEGIAWRWESALQELWDMLE